VRLPGCTIVDTGWDPLQMGLAAMLKPVVKAAGIDLTVKCIVAQPLWLACFGRV
jgi:hypothetical protein